MSFRTPAPPVRRSVPAPVRSSTRRLGLARTRRFELDDACYVVMNVQSYSGGVLPDGAGQGVYVPALVRGIVANEEGRVEVVLELCDVELGRVTRRATDNTREIRVAEDSQRLLSVAQYADRGHDGGSTVPSSGSVWRGAASLSVLEASVRGAAAEKRERERAKAEQVALLRRADVSWGRARWAQWRRRARDRSSLYCLVLRYAALLGVPCSPKGGRAFVVFTERRHLFDLSPDAARAEWHRWRAVYVEWVKFNSITEWVKLNSITT